MAQTSGNTEWRRYPKTVTIPAPAAGVDWRAIVPSGELWKLMSVYSPFTSSAVVATRVPNLTVSDGNASYAVIPPWATQAAGIAGTYLWLPGYVGNSVGNAKVTPLPDLLLSEGESIGPVTGAIDVGDQWGVTYVRVLATIVRFGSVTDAEIPDMSVRVVNMPNSAS